jgi:hypothetical protein
MRIITLTFAIASVMPVFGQQPAISPTEELRTSIREWVETKRKIQQEENDWSRDQEVLQNYKEGLVTEISSLKEQIASAKIRKEGADTASLNQANERDRYLAAKDELSNVVRKLEESLAGKLPYFPIPLLNEPKVAQGVEDFKRDLALPADKRGEGVSKRLLNLISLTTEAEKFQQTVTLRPELRKNADGREFNMQVIYFGLACAYAVNDDGDFALVGRPTADGWKFEERKELAPEIQKLISATTGDVDATFINLPLLKP